MGSLVNRRRYSGGKKDERLLPYGYFELKYIENTSNAYIDTGVKNFSVVNTTFYGTFVPKTNSQLQGLIGGRNKLDVSGTNYDVFISDTQFRLDWAKQTPLYYNYTPNSSYNIEIRGGFCKINSTIVYNQDVTDDNALYNFYIGAINNKGSLFGNGYIGLICECKLVENSKELFHLIPCLSPDNEVGMYDTVTKTFFKSPNGTAFVAGPKIYDGDDREAPYDYEVEYLESDGASYINSGQNASSNTTIDVNIYIPQSESSCVAFGSREGYLNKEFSYINDVPNNLKSYRFGSNIINESILLTKGWHNFNNKNNANILVIDGETILATAFNSFNNSYPIYIGALNNAGTVGSIKEGLRIGKIIIYQNGITAFDAIPVVKDGVACMYDKVSGTLFYNQGTGNFIVGPRVIHCTDNDYYGIRWLATDAPDSPIIRIGNMDWHRTLPIHSKMRRCILGDDGSKRYVSDSDYTKDTDGNAIDYTVSSANGVTYDTAVEMPEHCFLTGTETIDDVDYHYIKLFPKLMIGNFVPTHYMGAFEAMLDRTNNKLYSTVKANIVYNNDGEVDGASLTYAENWRGGNNSSSYDSDNAKTLMGRAVASLTITNFCTYANNRGSYYGITNWDARNNLCRLYAVEYANFDSQATFNPELNAYGYHQGGLGFGVCSTVDAWNAYNAYNPVMPCGVTLKLGNNTGVVRYNLGATYSSGATAATYFDVPSYRGIENPFAHIWENATGMYIHGSNSVDNIYVAEDGFHARTFPSNTDNTAPSGYKLRSNSLPLNAGWPVTLDWNDDGDFLAKTLDTSSTTADNKSVLRDYFWGQNANAKKLMVGGSLASSVRAGLFAVNVYAAVGRVDASSGARLLTVPKYNE